LDDASRRTEIAVDLRWRMRVPQVRKRALFQLLLQHPVRMIAITQPRPEIDFPRFAPPRATVTAGVKSRASRVGELRRCQRRDLMSRMQREKMRHMPVFVLGVIPIRAPLLDLAPRSNIEAAVETREGVVDLGRELVIAETTCGFGSVGEQVVD